LTAPSVAGGRQFALYFSSFLAFHAAAAGSGGAGRRVLLNPADYAHHVERFNAMEAEPVINVTRRDYFEQLMTYARAHKFDGNPYIGEYHDETTGKWLITGPKTERSRYYNHSTFNDLVITGLIGLVPSASNQLKIDPLVPEDA
jgi:hypothetical protein